ncbi:kinesin-like protein KIF19 [Lynx canadensis]|nr:kinesin-like protein KIF19 [Lynx canadensis]
MSPRLPPGPLPLGTGAHLAQVALRIRPLSDTELEEGATVIAHKVGDQVAVLMDPDEDPEDTLRAHRSREKTFIFDTVFDQHASQEDVYRATTQHLVEGVVSGYNATVFAYGPSGAGKTYTMLGMDAEPGVYLRTLSDLFRAIEMRGSTDWGVSMSYLEIYNEVIRDLLNPSSGFLDLREDSRGSIQMAGLTEVSTSNAQEIMHLLTKGNRQRTQEPTAANKTSSRSHAVLQVTVRQRSRGSDLAEGVRVGKLFMVDLAGSERASQAQNRGKRRKEGAHINRSLLALGNCINALSEKGGSRAQYVNFRDSKLTRLLKDALGGNSRTVMIAHISPASTHFEESRTTLLYAYRAKNIKTRVKRNLLNVSYHIAQYTDVISNLRREIEHLKSKIEKQEEEKRGEPGQGDHLNHLPIRIPSHDGEEDSCRQMNKIRAQLVGAFKEQLEMRRSLVELENTNIELHVDMSRHLLTIADPAPPFLRFPTVPVAVQTRPGALLCTFEVLPCEGAIAASPQSPSWEREKAQHLVHRDRTPEGDEEPAEADGDEGDSVEPPEVAVAREEVNTLLAEQRKAAALKAGLEQRLASAKEKASQLEKLLPAQASSEDQREVLRLLCWAHELEAENTELRADGLRRRSLLWQKDFVIQRYHQHRLLCEQLLRDQRQLIEGGGLAVPESLDERYGLILRELGAGSLNRLLLLHSVMSSSLRDGLVLNKSPAPQEETSWDWPDDRKDLPWGAQFELPLMLLEEDRYPILPSRDPASLRPRARLWSVVAAPVLRAHVEEASPPSRKDTVPCRLGPTRSSEGPDAVFGRSAQAEAVPFGAGPLSVKNLVSKLGAPAGLDLGASRMAAEAGGPALSAQTLKEMAMSTKSIALIAATRRSKAQDREGGSGRSSLHLPEDMALDSRDPSPADRRWPHASPGRDRSAEKARGKLSPSLTWSVQTVTENPQPPSVEHVAKSQPPPAPLPLTKSSGKSFLPAVSTASKIKPSPSLHADEKVLRMPEVTFTLPSATWQGSPGPRRTPLAPRDIRGQCLPRPHLRIALSLRTRTLWPLATGPCHTAAAEPGLGATGIWDKAVLHTHSEQVPGDDCGMSGRVMGGWGRCTDGWRRGARALACGIRVRWEPAGCTVSRADVHTHTVGSRGDAGAETNRMSNESAGSFTQHLASLQASVTSLRPREV